MRALAALTRPWRRSQRELREHLKTLFRANNVDCVVDVGAHRGKFYRLLREDLAFAGPVVSVEPIAELAAELEKRARREAGWRIRRCGEVDEHHGVVLRGSPKPCRVLIERRF
ncbi:MAG TPA: hypothetical protein VHG88_11890 [Burkholderiales bacterium]|nr:hypothetical protein [Burkholderiales bacterium]